MEHGTEDKEKGTKSGEFSVAFLFEATYGERHGDQCTKGWKAKKDAGELRPFSHARGMLRRGPLRLETGGAEDGSPPFRFWSGLEGDLTGSATLSADGVMERSGAPVGLAGRTAALAPLRGLKVPLCVKLLFPVRERERRAAVAASKLLISHTVERRKIKR